MAKHADQETLTRLTSMVEDACDGQGVPREWKDGAQMFADVSGDFDFEQKFGNGDFAAWCVDAASGLVVFDVSAQGRELAKKIFRPVDDVVLYESWPLEQSERLYRSVVDGVQGKQFRPLIVDIETSRLEDAWQRPLEYAIAYKMLYRRRQKTDRTLPNVSIRIGRMGWRVTGGVHWELG